MDHRQYIALEDRGVLAVSGPDARSYLQALVSNDMEKPSGACAIYATLLASALVYFLKGTHSPATMHGRTKRTFTPPG